MRTLLLLVRPPQSQRTIDDLIRQHIYSCSLHLQTIKLRCPCSELSLVGFGLRPFGAAAVVQTTSIYKVRILMFYQSTMSLLVIDFTHWEGRDGDIVVKELAAVDCHSNTVSSYVFKRPYGWKEIPMFIARMNDAIDHLCNWNEDDILY